MPDPGLLKTWMRDLCTDIPCALQQLTTVTEIVGIEANCSQALKNDNRMAAAGAAGTAAAGDANQ